MAYVYSESEKAAMAKRAAAGYPRGRTKGLLVYLTIRTWGGQVTDKEQTEEVCKRTGATKGQARVTKKLPKDEELAGWNDVCQKLTSLYTHWCQASDDISKGSRFCRAKTFSKFKSLTDELIAEADQKKKDFERIYPDILKDGPNRLGSMWDETRYPKVDEIGSHFEIKLDVRPLPTAAELKFEDLSIEEQEAVRASVEKGFSDFVQSNRTSARKKAKAAVTRLVERVGALLSKKEGDGTGRFYNSVIESLQEIVKEVSEEEYDLKEDAELDAAFREIEEKLLKYSPERIRGDSLAAKEVLDDAKAIEQKIRDWA